MLLIIRETLIATSKQLSQTDKLVTSVCELSLKTIP